MSETAFILCGGLGTRLGIETQKTLLEIQGRALLDYNISLMKRHGIKKIILGVGHYADHVKNKFGSGDSLGVNIIYSEEDKPMGTAGALKLAKNHIENRFVMCNGDEVKDIDLDEMIKLHEKNNALITIALTTIEDPSSFGVAKLDGDRIVEFVEKPKKEEAPSNLINSGLYIVEPEVIEMIPDGSVSIERDIFPIIAEKNKLFGFKFSSQWFPTDTVERIERAKNEWKPPF
ncbi:MAG: nucleotidyltransferase family protein [Candidatus Aenigmatarchaeota archaeon]